MQRKSEHTIRLQQKPQPAEETIARLAYQLWMERGCPDGSPEADWLRAERELTEHHERGQRTAA